MREKAEKLQKAGELLIRTLDQDSGSGLESVANFEINQFDLFGLWFTALCYLPGHVSLGERLLCLAALCVSMVTALR